MTWEHSRPTHVPAKVRTECLTRDGNQCTAILNTGERCTERNPANLEAAHLTQWQTGEQTTSDMVRTLCHWHHSKETTAQAAQARAAQRRKRPKPYHPRDKHPAHQ